MSPRRYIDLAAAEAAEERQRRVKKQRIFANFSNRSGYWNILRYLFIHQAVDLVAGDVCRNSGLPKTSAMRRIDEMIDAGLMERRKNLADKRSEIFGITSRGISAVEDYYREKP